MVKVLSVIYCQRPILETAHCAYLVPGNIDAGSKILVEDHVDWPLSSAKMSLFVISHELYISRVWLQPLWLLAASLGKWSFLFLLPVADKALGTGTLELN